MAQNASGEGEQRPQGTNKRRRRRRGSSHAQNAGQNSGQNSGSKDGTHEPKRRRKRRSGSGNQQGNPKSGNKNSRGDQRGDQGGNQGGNQRSGKRGSQRSNQRSNQRGNQRNQYRKPQSRSAQYTSAPKMETRDETSAGGLVVSGMAEAVAADGSVDVSQIYVALIGRLDRRGRLLWSMPKGHVEDGEHQWDTARREVWEETGIYGEPFEELGLIDYWFVSDGVRIHKTVHHNLLRFVDGVLNDEDPEVTEVAWIPVSELIEHLAYADERKLARIACDRMPDLARAEKEAGRVTPR